MFRIITIAREFGSGGAAIAGMVAQKLGWRLLDSAIIADVARQAQVSPDMARAYDERLDSWTHRVAKRALWHGSIEGVAAVSGQDFFDAEAVAALTGELIRQASAAGNCVIVGRGGQCRLQGNPGAFHVFVHGRADHKVARLRRRETGDLQALMTSTDKVRSGYIRSLFQCDWKDPSLYHLMIDSGLGEERVAETILYAGGFASVEGR